MKVLLAVSGGADSMYMASRAPELMPETDFGVAHCNFGLRADESDGDEVFVRKWAEAKGYPFFSKRFDTAGEAERKGVSIEMAARNLRYDWFSEICRKMDYDAVAIAHNANDNAETLMLNLLRGTGIRGLRGMSSERRIKDCSTIILRPILSVERQDIKAWLVENNVSWREDHTNSENEYKRNKIRNEVFPVFKNINPSFICTLNENMRRFSQADDIVQDYFEQAKKTILDNNHINVKLLSEDKHWKYILFRLTEGYVNEYELQSLIGAIESKRQLAGKTFGKITCTNNELIFVSEVKTRQPVIEEFERFPGMSVQQPTGTLILDADLLPDIIIRPWREGDWMIPLGMKGKKKLSDLFVDLKYSLEDKKRALVVEYPKDKNRVAALLYERIDDSMKVTDATKRILKFQ